MLGFSFFLRPTYVCTGITRRAVEATDRGCGPVSHAETEDTGLLETLFSDKEEGVEKGNSVIPPLLRRGYGFLQTIEKLTCHV